MSLEGAGQNVRRHMYGAPLGRPQPGRTGSRFALSSSPDDRRRAVDAEEQDYLEHDAVEEDLEVADESVQDPAVPVRNFRLTEPQIEEIAGRLRAGKALPPYLLPYLFERPREYELTYAGKMRPVDVIAETMAMPLQPVKSFGTQPGSWGNMLILGDNLQVLRSLLTMKQEGALKNADGTDGVRLCYIDPPFSTARDFNGGGGQIAYRDRVEGAEFIEALRRRLIVIYELLAADGSLYIHLDQRKVHYVKVILDEMFTENGFRNEITWKRTTSHSDAKRFGIVHETLLYYVKGPGAPFNPPLVPLDVEYVARYYRYTDEDERKFMSADLTANHSGPAKRFGDRGMISPPPGRQWAYNQAGINRLLKENRVFFTRNGIPRRKIYLDETVGMPAPDVWNDILPVVSWSSERTPYPTQKPRALLERIVNASSRPGDIVLDCFVGSGTTLEAAEVAEGGARRWIGVDCGKFAIYTSQARLLRLADGPASFTVFNAGLYDYRALRELPWDAYRAFALRLFQAREERADLGGFVFDGVLHDDPVHVFNFKEHPDATIGEAYVRDLADVAGRFLSDRCYIIAPALSVDPYEDYLDVEGIRFFFLRIPYSVIAELHKRAFTELRQPDSNAVANEMVDAVGFDFIRPPEVKCSYVDDGDLLVVQITSFESEAYGADDPDAPIEDLAMVMVDYNYRGDIFDVDDVIYADQLAKAEWRFSIPKASVGDQIMIVYLDVFGNEHREAKTPNNFSSSKRRRSA